MTAPGVRMVSIRKVLVATAAAAVVLTGAVAMAPAASATAPESMSASASTAAVPMAKAKKKYLLSQSEMSDLMLSQTPIEVLTPPTVEGYSASAVYAGTNAYGSKFIALVGYDYYGSKSFTKGCQKFASKEGFTLSTANRYLCVGTKSENGATYFLHIQNTGEGWDSVGVVVVQDAAANESNWALSASNYAGYQSLKLNKFGFGTRG